MNLFFLQDGVIEIYTKTDEGHDFVLEKLFRGSIINYRVFFLKEESKVYYKFGRNSIVSILPIDIMNDIYPRHPILKKQFLNFQKSTIAQEKTFILDYIMNLPKHLRREDQDQQKQTLALKLENLLKNVVMQKLSEIRAVRDKPSLKDMINDYLKKQQKKDERAAVRIKEQVLQMYEQKTFQKFEDNDPNFNKIIVHIERLLKITTAQTLAIDSLERKIMNISKRNPVVYSELIIPK